MPEPVYGIDERPARLAESVLYGWQHTLVDISPFVLPLAVAAALGLDPLHQAALINYGLIAMGLATLLQTGWGNRLPIVQGPSATLTGTLAPVGAQLGAGAMWGAVMVGALVEAACGASGAIGRIRRWMPTWVSAAVVVAIGLSLGRLAVRLAWGDGSTGTLALAGAVIALVIGLRLLGRDRLRGVPARGAIFIAIWVVGLGVGGPTGAVDWELVAARPWLELPTLFPWGGPGFGWEWSLAAVLAVLAGYLASMVESVGDYVATCSVAGVRFERRHIDRGIRAEGVGCALAACLGGLPCTSYTQNVGIIATTGVASRHVVRVAAVILLGYGLCPKFGALLVALPRSVLGGVFVLVCVAIVGSGVGLLRRGDDRRGVALAAVAVALGVLGTELLGLLAPAETASEVGWMLATHPVVVTVVGALLLNLLAGAPADRSGPAPESR